MLRKLLILAIGAGHTMACLSHTLTLALTGDIMMGTTYPKERLPQGDGRFLFGDTRDILRRADLTVGNLEGVLCDSGETRKEGKPHKYAFRTPTAYAWWLKDAGYDFVSMANNHSFDFGVHGVRATERALRKQGIAFAGIAGRSETAVVVRKGVRIGLCALGHNSYTVSHLDLRAVGRLLRQLRRQSDIVVVSFHGGAEGVAQSHLPDSMERFLGERRGALRRLAHYCVNHGADVVYGHGPHVVRGVEVYKGRFIAYSLGNFCTPFGINLQGLSGYAPIVTVTIDRKGRFLKGRIHSFIQHYGIGPRRHDGKRLPVVRQMKALSEADFPDSEARIDPRGNIRLL